MRFSPEDPGKPLNMSSGTWILKDRVKKMTPGEAMQHLGGVTSISSYRWCGCTVFFIFYFGETLIDGAACAAAR